MEEMIKSGSYVQIYKIELKPEERTGKLPDDTKQVPLELWVKGFLQKDAKMNDQVAIKTITGRIEEGTLVAVNPAFNFGFGETYVPELLQVGIQVRKIVKGE
ncbi:2-amino-4-oxopentanoate thiolase subunit OrtA [Bacillus sp. 1NLA3E]|uniref:2-amino-4-oxopentanoate thiolase subunit OrtA n=1 Tax=Bacillus sp. 1NLA3E TaxID=666686 RepID=UPI000247EDCE|nr:2-amino-4-oxopentanoate thiolase subunit OrtA [Bacillus sp. 1NLA3E]AGK53712.1 2-amino-4-ketopentanoate thiolase (AKPT), alpha subunit [Bacillus sp. 1NLA3E]